MDIHLNLALALQMTNPIFHEGILVIFLKGPGLIDLIKADSFQANYSRAGGAMNSGPALRNCFEAII